MNRPLFVALILPSLFACATTPDPENDPDGSVAPEGGNTGECSDCDDFDPCNGVETCGPTGDCFAGEDAEDGTACTNGLDQSGQCVAGRCVVPTCGDGQVDPGEDCDDGNSNPNDGCTGLCEFGCTSDAQCDDELLCNGAETCDMSTNGCVPGVPLDCDDGDACTMDSCEDTMGCISELIDGDGDGQGPTAGGCGMDCDDTNADVYAGAPEACDGVDNNCVDGTSDEGEVAWYFDCDGDGYAPSAAEAASFVRRSCAMPSENACSTPTGTWTTRRPLFGADCDDTDAAVHPGAAEIIGDERDQNCDGRETCHQDRDNDGFRSDSGLSFRFSSDLDCDDPGEAPSSAPRTDCCDTDANARPTQTGYFSQQNACGNFDYNCDGSTTRRYTQFTTDASCSGSGMCSARTGTRGRWIDRVPACGRTRDYHAACRNVVLSCRPRIDTRTQVCR